MMKQYTAIAAIGLGLLTPNACEPTLSANTPTKPPCQNEVILLDSIHDETDCDVSPPQTLAAHIDDSPDAWAECADAGGQVLHDRHDDHFICINMDY